MKIEQILMIAASLISVLSLFFIPKANRLQAQFIFLFVQFPTWLLGLVAVELKLLEYPVHELGHVNSTSFIFEYLILPIYCIHFNARYPRRATKLIKTLFYIGASLALTGVEVIVEAYTDIIEYTGWQWYITFLTVLFILWLSRISTLWFFKKTKPVHAGQERE
jgi:hypothetical protein